MTRQKLEAIETELLRQYEALPDDADPTELLDEIATVQLMMMEAQHAPQ